MIQSMHNIFFTSNKVGYSDIFSTVTCNARWPEIKNALLPRQSFVFRLAIVARVFCIRPHALMAFVIDEKMFGELKAHVRGIEFQMCDMSHTYCIFFMTSKSKTNLLDPTFIDTIISAKLRDKQNTLLFQVVLKHIVHNPYGYLNPSAVCMMGKFCSKNFPKEFVDETNHDESQLYVNYRRRSPKPGSETAPRTYQTPRKPSIISTIDNSWDVLYCPKLPVMFQCHITAELCVPKVCVIKYLFKYVCKVFNRVTIKLGGSARRYDETGNFQDARSGLASERLWRLFQF